MKKLSGNIGGLKSSQIDALERLHDFQTPVDYVISPELRDEICRISVDIRRQTGVLINRQGMVVTVLVGDHDGLMIPDISEYRVSAGRLKGLRLVHTHLNGEGLSPDDLTDLALLRLDLIAVTVSHMARRMRSNKMAWQSFFFIIKKKRGGKTNNTATTTTTTKKSFTIIYPYESKQASKQGSHVASQPAPCTHTHKIK